MGGVSPTLHRPTCPKPTTVKPPRCASVLRQKPRCVVCSSDLRGDHALGDLVCDCHPRDGYNPRHDPSLDEHILTLLWRAGGSPLNLYRALGCDSLKENYNAVQESVARLNASGMVRVVGAGKAGRKLAVIRRSRGSKMKS